MNMSNTTDTTTPTVADRLKNTGSGVARFAGLIVGFFILAMIGAAILGPGAGLKAWVALLIFAFVYIT